MTSKYYGALDDMENILVEGEERVSDCDDGSIEGSEDSDALLEQVGDACNKQVRNTVIGVVFAFLSGGIFTANNFLIKELDVVVSDAVLVRCILQIIILSFIIITNGEKLLPDNRNDRLFTIAQGISGATTLITSLTCITFMPVADGLTLMFCCPAVTILLSAMLLGDRLTCTKVLAGVSLVLGAVFVCQPSLKFGQTGLRLEDGGQYAVGVALASTCCFAGGLMDVLISKAQGVSLPVLVNWVGLCGLMVSIIYSLLDPSSLLLSSGILSMSIYDWLLLVGLALGGLTAFSLMVKSLHLISPNLVSSLRSTELVVAFVVQTVLTGQAPNLWKCLGASLVMAGVLLLSLQEKIDLVVALFLRWISTCTK